MFKLFSWEKKVFKRFYFSAYANALVEVSFIEIYNEAIRDLLNTN